MEAEGSRSVAGEAGGEPHFVRDRKPNGGWGWIVTIGLFIVFVLTSGSSWAFGILYIAFLDAFNESKAITAVPGSLIYMTMVVTCPYAGLLADKYGHRPVIFVGGIVSSLAIFASSFANDFTTLTVMYGLVAGVGFGLSHMPALMMLSHYFDTKIGTATGIAVSGTGIGIIFMSVVTQHLVNEFGWRGTMMVLSAINANLCVAAAVMRPVKRRLRLIESYDWDDAHVVRAGTVGPGDTIYNRIPKEDKPVEQIRVTPNPLHEFTTTDTAILRTNSASNTMSCGIERTPELESSGHAKMDMALNLLHVNGTTQYATSGVEVACEKAKEAERESTTNSSWCIKSGCKPVATFFDSVYGFALWKNPMYLLFLMGINLAFFGMTIVSAHVAKRALEFGIHDTYSSSLVAVLGLSQAAGRFLSGSLIDRCRLNPLLLYQSMTAMCGISIIVGIYVPTFPAQVSFCAVAGYTTGACATIQTVMCGSLFGTGQLKYAYSGVILAVGIAMLSSPPIAGLCRDVQGNYVGAFFMAAAACFSSVMAHMPLSCTIKPGKNLVRTPISDELQHSAELMTKV